MILVIESPGQGRRELPLTRGLLTIGRGADCDVALQEPQASRHHAELRRLGDQWLVVDLRSTNGTLIEGRPLPPEQPSPLQPGQTIVIGSTRLRLQPDEQTVPMAQPSFDLADARPAAAPARSKPSPLLLGLIWFSRLLVAASVVSLVFGSQGDWVRIRAQLPLVGTVFDRTFTGMDSGYGWLLLVAAVLAALLLLVDVVTRRWGMAAGLGQALMAASAGVALGVTAYSYYQTGSQSVFGISLLDVFTKYARNVVKLSVQPGVYLAAVGLGGLLLGGLLRLVTAGMEPTE